MILAQSPTDVVKIADYASRQSDRWMFIAILVLFIIGCLYAFRELMKDRAIWMQAWKEDRKNYQDTMYKMVTEGHTVSTTLAVALDRNTAALVQNNRLLEKDI